MRSLCCLDCRFRHPSPIGACEAVLGVLVYGDTAWQISAATVLSQTPCPLAASPNSQTNP